MTQHTTRYCLFLLFIVQVSCAPKVPFVWVDCLPVEEQATSVYRIQPGDDIEISVWDQAQISGSYIVREDGFVTVPLVGDILIKGFTPTEAADAIATKLEGGIVKDVRVVVIARATTPKFVSILGEVNRTGQIDLSPKDTVIDILAKAGGLSEFADENAIYVFRPDEEVKRIRFNYDRLTTTVKGGFHFKLKDGDVIIVE